MRDPRKPRGRFCVDCLTWLTSLLINREGPCVADRRGAPHGEARGTLSLSRELLIQFPRPWLEGQLTRGTFLRLRYFFLVRERRVAQSHALDAAPGSSRLFAMSGRAVQAACCRGFTLLQDLSRDAVQRSCPLCSPIQNCGGSPPYCRLVINCSSAAFGGRTIDSGSDPRG